MRRIAAVLGSVEEARLARVTYRFVGDATNHHC